MTVSEIDSESASLLVLPSSLFLKDSYVDTSIRISTVSFRSKLSNIANSIKKVLE